MVSEEPFTNTRNDGIVGKGEGQVVYGFGPLVMDGGLSLHGSRAYKGVWGRLDRA